jgi:hypothetical protein
MTDFALTAAARDAILAEVRSYGARNVETGGFLLAPIESPKILQTVALAGSAGVERRFGLFEVSAEAINQIFTWASEHELRIAAQVHSHGRRAFLSSTDIEHGFSVEGFTTAVIPYFRDPPIEPSDWGWWVYKKEWTSTTAPTLVEGDCKTIRFDADGVDES